MIAFGCQAAMLGDSVLGKYDWESIAGATWWLLDADTWRSQRRHRLLSLFQPDGT